jgi:ATP-dependent DNA helicase RecG
MLDHLPQQLVGNEALDAAILARRLGREEAAHRYFEKAGTASVHDTRALLEFAQTKIRLAQKRYKAADLNRFDRQASRQLLHEARELLERLLQMDADKARHAWAWRELARIRQWLAYPVQDIRDAYNGSSMKKRTK